MWMKADVFLLGLLVVSTLTGLVTEAAKKFLRELGKNPPPNLLAGIVAVVIAVAVAAGYLVLSGVVFTAKAAVYMIALVFLSWLAAMVGYDKVVQALAQLGQHRKG